MEFNLSQFKDSKAVKGKPFMETDVLFPENVSPLLLIRSQMQFSLLTGFFIIKKQNPYKNTVFQSYTVSGKKCCC